MRKIAAELDPLRIGTGWKVEDLSKPQIFIESTFGDSHPGSGHLDKLVEAARQGVAEAGGYGARYFTTDKSIFHLSESKCTVFARFQNVQRVQIIAKLDKECRNSKLKTCDVSQRNSVKT